MNLSEGKDGISIMSMDNERQRAFLMLPIDWTKNHQQISFKGSFTKVVLFVNKNYFRTASATQISSFPSDTVSIPSDITISLLR